MPSVISHSPSPFEFSGSASSTTEKVKVDSSSVFTSSVSELSLTENVKTDSPSVSESALASFSNSLDERCVVEFLY